MPARRLVQGVLCMRRAPCGRAVTGEGDAIVAVHGDTQEPCSRGFSCPKAYGVQERYDDLDRLCHPVRRTAPS
jgi:anaerobic selenocysteine-containing dehydrogenase